MHCSTNKALYWHTIAKSANINRSASRSKLWDLHEGHCRIQRCKGLIHQGTVVERDLNKRRQNSPAAGSDASAALIELRRLRLPPGCWLSSGGVWHLLITLLTPFLLHRLYSSAAPTVQARLCLPFVAGAPPASPAACSLSFACVPVADLRSRLPFGAARFLAGALLGPGLWLRDLLLLLCRPHLGMPVSAGGSS